ncbi:hypothetical protein FA15DRAFT_726631 [Coprinopsis marcescibilis]|uniref:Sterol regulatory element-binding protein cleavage-activating protein n=1 Tax=Coprinopsis marcescibilis TaxID=230819 RepID=A0A5C3L344_COPMA|nr:hypothetical protein FA15DRAFT_726631 [Coprinopsis marcescibilis]
MLALVARPLQWARSVGRSFFLQFGLHCATHQIRVILISCVVITSLFYPALALYSSSQPKLHSVFDAFAPPNTFSAVHAQQDLVNLWSGYDSLRTHEDAVALGKCRTALRVERIFIQSPILDDEGALNHRILTSTLEFEQRLNKLIASSDDPCLEKPGGGCFVLSPLAFWNYDRDTLSTDDTILDTLSNPNSRNVTIAGIPVSPQMVLAGRGDYERSVGGTKFDFATFLAITYFFPDSDCLGSNPHAQWVQMVEKAASQDAIVSVQIQEPKLIALDFNQNVSLGWSAISTFLYLAYAGFIAYVAWSVRRMTAVHSRLGVTFTALVEITVSTITSLSVCALVGFRITMVPWELLPIVIVFVGAENMFTLVDAVGKTSVTLSVKQRIAEGLSHAGTSNTLKVVAYNTILGILAVVSVGAIRQFCIFAIVVLVAHWFLAHTFFIAVLSIDIARLELEELLMHDALAAAPPIHGDQDSDKQSGSNASKKSLHRLLKGRATTNISLVMLLAITATLYYATSTGSTTPQLQVGKPLGGLARAKNQVTNLQPMKKPTAEQIWHVLNPDQRTLLHVRVEVPTSVTLHPAKEGKPYRTRKTMASVVWILKIMVLPIAATTSALYGLLLYLLKNTELLETQHSSSTEMVEEVKSLDSQVSFSTLPRAIGSDVELIASSKDGEVVVTIGLRNELIVWKSESGSYLSIDAGDVLLSEPSSSDATSSLTCLTIDDSGNFLAIGTNTGIIALWVLVGSKVTALPVLALEDVPSAITDLHFISSQPPRSDRKVPIPPPAYPVILATYENGTAARWSVERMPTVTRYSPSREVGVVQASLLHVTSDNSVLIAFSLEDGTLDLRETGDYSPVFLNDYCIQPGSSLDHVGKIHACRADLNGTVRPIIAAATERGTVSLWDGLTGECISVLDELQGRVNMLKITPVSPEACHFCGQLPAASISVAFSVDHVVRFFNLYINDQMRRCACTNGRLRHNPSRDTLGRRSRSNSTASSRIGSPLIPRARLATAFEVSDFPVSGHGVHSRRASEKEGRRSLDQLQVPSFHTDDQDSRHQNGTATPNPQSQLWQGVIVLNIGDFTCERGGWDLTSCKFIGIRRKPRSQGKSKGGTTHPVTLTPTQGLTRATLERWELWTFDPSAARLRCSVLSDLSLKPLESRKRCSSASSSTSSPPPSPSGDRIARLPFTRVSPLLISSSHALAGFGNTVGIFHFSSDF